MKQLLFILAAIPVLLFAGCSKDDELPVNSPIAPETDLYGVVADTQGNLLQGVVVSDGYSACATDANGVYQIKRNPLAYQVYISIPEQYEVPISDGHPCFWQQLNDRTRYDFTLKALDGGIENNFKLFCVADPQCQTTTNVDRFTSETTPDILAEAQASDIPVYGITLGDIIWNSAGTDCTNAVMPLMKLAMRQEKVGFPLFQVIGNHDNKTTANKTYSVEADVAAQRNFEYALGPVNYSFNRGNTHIVAMDNIIYTNHDNYTLGFRDDQLEWLTQDLSFVPKDKMIILCVHIPLRNSNNTNVQAVLRLLEEFSDVHIMSGHTHYAQNTTYGEGIYEHVHGAVCGAWWNSTINVDGTPNGYSIYKISRDEMTDWRYKATACDADFQIRLYRGSDIFMEDYSKNYKFYYNAANQIVANIWNADASWTIDVYENGTKTGSMIPYASTSNIRYDAWALGYHIGVVGKSEVDKDGKATDYFQRNVSHLYYYTLQNPSATVEVRATDRFGKSYKQSLFTTGKAVDFPVVK